MKNLILTVILLILSIKGIYACTGCFSANMAKSRDSVFHQELYSQGKISPEEAESWHIGIASDFNWDINKSGCLDTLPVVILEKTGSVLPEFRVKCIKNLPDNINYIKSISSAFKHIDVSNRKALPANTQYLVNVSSLTLLNPHRIRSLEPMYELKKLSGLTFYQNNGSLLPEDFERLLGEVVKLKQLNHLAFAGGFPDEITEKSMHYIQQLEFLSALRIPPEAQGKSSDIIRKYLPDNVKLR